MGGSECWAINNKKNRKMKVAAIRMLMNSGYVVWSGWIELEINIYEEI